MSQEHGYCRPLERREREQAPIFPEGDEEHARVNVAPPCPHCAAGRMATGDSDWPWDTCPRCVP